MWKRNEFTTKGADPTVVVDWCKGNTVLREFQGVYMVVGECDQDLVKELHQALEDAYDLQNNVAFDGDPDAKIYGGA